MKVLQRSFISFGLITNRLATVFWLPGGMDSSSISRMAITNDLAARCLSQMASSFTSSHISPSKPVQRSSWRSAHPSTRSGRTEQKHDSISPRNVPIALLFFAACSAVQAATPAESPHGIGAGYFMSHDTESFSTNAISYEYLSQFTHGSDLTGVRVTLRDYSQHDWRRESQQVAFIKRSVDPATANGWQLDAGVSVQGMHDTITLDGSYHRPLAARLGFDAFINRDWVETRAALDRGIDFTFGGISLDQGIGEHWTVVGVVGRQMFSDGNAREHYRAKLVFQPMLDSGLTLQLRYRTFHSSSLNVGGAYFNPASYDETLFAVGWRKRIEGWVLRAAAGAGVQHVNSDPGSDTKLLELQADSPYRGNQFIRLRGGYNQSASFGGPNYAYTYLPGEWLLRF